MFWRSLMEFDAIGMMVGGRILALEGPVELEFDLYFGMYF